MKKVKPISPAIKSFSNTQKINSVGWTILFCLTSSQLALAQSNNQGSLTPARAASIATSTAITSSIINNPFGGFGTYRWKLGANSNNPSVVLEAKNPNSLNPDDYSGGLAGSADWSNWSVWATPVISQFKNNIAPNTSNGTVVIGLAGLEYNMDDTLISGLSLAADSTSSNTTYNSGTYKSTGLTVSPYLAYQINDSWLFDLSAGYGGSNPTTTVGSSTGTTNYTRFFSAIGLTDRIELSNKLTLTPRASYTMYKDSLDAYTSSTGTYNSALTTYLYQTKIGAQLAFDAKVATPFIAAYQLINSWSASQSNTPPSVYPSSYQVIAGINASKGIFYGTVAYQIERSTSQFRLYGGLRF